jgi:signal transduction histidine kinase
VRPSSLTLFIFLLLPPLHAAGQTVQHQIDSLENLIQDSRKSVDRVDIYNQLAVLYYNIDIKKSMHMGQEALELAQDLQYDRGIQSAHGILRRVHRRLGNYSVAIEYTLKNLPISERLRDTVELLDSYTTLGNINSSMGNYTEALPFLLKAYSIGKKTKSDQIANILNYVGRNYGKLGRYDSAQYYIQQALIMEVSNPQPGYSLSYIYNNLAEIYYYKKDYTKAIEFYKLSESLGEGRKSQYGLTFTYNGMALVYQAMGEPAKAIEYAQRSIEIGKQNTFRDKTKEAYGILYDIYQQQGDYRNALENYRMFNVYQDSIFSEDRIQYIENLKINYETDRIRQENELLRKDAELKDYQIRQQFTLAWVAFTAISLLLAVSVLLYRINKQRRKSNAFLQEYNRNLESQVTDRTQELVNTNLELIRQNNQLEQFGYITAHNLRAPVARILGLTGIIRSNDFNMPRDREVVDKLHSAADELDAIIHDLNNILDIKKGILSTYEHVDLQERIDKIINSLTEKIKESGAVIESDFRAAPTCYGIPAYVESILYNLVSNSIKYRSPDRVPHIRIRSSMEGNDLLIVLQDNGIGIDLQKLKDKVFTLYQRFHHHVEGKGIGLYLVRTQVEALNGTIEIESEVNEGSLFRIRIPQSKS